MGVSYGDTLPWMSQSALDQTLSDAVSVGVNWIRADLSWADVQPDGASAYSWVRFDQVVAAARAKHLVVLPVLAYTPPWARASGCTSDKCPPADPAQFAAFASAAAYRYAPQGIHAWEIWNEPNSATFWAPAADVTQYVTLLRAVAPAIRQADPGAGIVTGGLAPESTANGNVDDLSFLQGICNGGGLQVASAVGWHPYSFPVPPSYNVAWSRWTRISGTSPSVQSILSGCGFDNMKVWLTEYGAPTQGPGVTATANDYQLNANPPPDHVDENLQAVMATQSVQLSQSSSTIAALFWYTNIDLGTDTSQPWLFYGLRRYDGTAKPAYGAYRSAIAQARGS